MNKYNKNVVRMIKSCHISKMSLLVPLSFFFGTWYGMQYTHGLITQRNKTSISRYNSLQKKKVKLKVEILLQYACEIKLWVLEFENSYLQCSVDDFEMQSLLLLLLIYLK